MKKTKKRKKYRASLPFRTKFPPWLLWVFFAMLALVSFNNADDYGITWDEVIQRQHGMVSMDYINDLTGESYYNGNLTKYDLQDYEHSHYGVLFPLFMTHIDVLFRIRSFREVFITRRIGVFGVFLIGLFFLYKTVSYHLKNRWMGFLACLMAVLSPRIFAHGHFNSKDIILMAGYMMAAYTMIRFLDKPNYRWALVHGLACGIAINTRILGMAIPAMTLAWFVLDQFFIQDRNLSLKKQLGLPALFLGSTVICTIALWPYLWLNPIEHFVESFQKLSHFHWNSDMVFMGERVKPANLPWYYIPVWIGITTPLMYSLFFLLGAHYGLRAFFKNISKKILYTNKIQRNWLVLIGLVLAPVLMVIIQNSSIYNGWRHMYFIYLPFLALAVSGFYILWRSNYNRIFLRYLIPGLLALNMLTSLVFILRQHPLQAMYFNVLAGEDVERNYDVEYWGSSLQALYKKLLDRTDKEHIKIHHASWNSPVHWNHAFLPHELKNRVEIVSGMDQADYYITLYLWEDWTKRNRRMYPFNRHAIQVRIGDMPVSGAYILR